MCSILEGFFWTVFSESFLIMVYVHFAVVNEACSVCGQGRVLVALEEDQHSLFVICEDCESEWNEPRESHDASKAGRDQHSFLRYLEFNEMKGHSWYVMLVNK
ncbi:hypothetical protein MyNCGM70_03870 [Achromobacter xylosoxidans]|jgi:hypothetical protein